jgi:hypothetical protein
MGFLATNAENNVAQESTGLQNTAGAYMLLDTVNSNNDFNTFQTNMTSQITSQMATIDALNGPTASYFGPTALPGIGSTGPTGDQSAANVGRSYLLGS